jgi:HAD superfamily hydrolase (TIGR01484 family)
MIFRLKAQVVQRKPKSGNERFLSLPKISTLRFMKNIQEFTGSVQFLLTDIDDTMTDEGHLGPQAYKSLWDLKNAGIQVIPVTGRPAGWCEMIARQWPVAGVVGENGAFYFRYFKNKMHRHFAVEEKLRMENQAKLAQIEKEVLVQIPGTAVASDQFCRLFDLAIDFCEDVPPLPKSHVQKIVDVFTRHGAQAKVSSIHVNGWFGDYNKLSESLLFLKNEFGLSAEDAKKTCAFAGDSPNDEPMWGYFPQGFAVSNISAFLDDLKSQPAFVAAKRGGLGFKEIADQIIRNKK